MKIRQVLLGVLLVFALMFGITARAQTPDTSVGLSVNVGDPSWSTFIFGHAVNGEPGASELIIQCDYKRAEFITNFDVYGQQLVSNFFPVTCAETVSFVNGQRVTTFNLNVPPPEALVMSGRDANGTPVTSYLVLTISSANWVVRGGGRWQTDSGSSQITY